LAVETRDEQLAGTALEGISETSTKKQNLRSGAGAKV
jgi:hypothetical protein